MQTILIAVHLLVVIALVSTVLLQRSEGGALGMGGSDGFMTGRGQANALTRATAILAAMFFATSIGLTLIANYGRAPTSTLMPAAPVGNAAPGNALPAPSTKGTALDALKQYEKLKEDAQKNAPAAPAAPAPAAPAPTASAPAPAPTAPSVPAAPTVPAKP